MAAQFAAGGSVIPFITLLFRERGLDFSQTSLIFTASSATLLVFPFVWGMLADRFLPLNRLFLILNLGACAALGVLATQRSFLGMLIGYTGYFACFNPTLYLMNALCFHHLPNPREQFSAVRAWGSLGWIVPFLPISLWLTRGTDVPFDFVLYLGMACALAMVLISFWLPHTPPGARDRARKLRLKVETAVDQGGPLSQGVADPMRPAYGRALRALLWNRNYMVLLLSMFLMAGSFSLLTYYSPARLQEIGIPKPWIGPVQALGVIFEIVLFRFQPALLRRWNYARLVLAGCVALAVRHLLFGMVDNAWVLGASYLLAGVVIVFYNQGVSVLVNTLATVQVRATAQTLLLLCGQGLGPLFANALAGRLAGQSGSHLRPIFLLAALLSAVAALVIMVRGSRLNAEQTSG